MTALAIATILVGALETAGGLQELVVQGIFNNQRIPLAGGTLGTVAGAFILSTGIGMFRRSADAARLARATAGVCVPTYILIGLVWRLAGWPATILGLVLPLILVAATRRAGSSPPGASVASEGLGDRPAP